MPGLDDEEIPRRIDRFAREMVLPRLTRFGGKASIVTKLNVFVPGLAPEPGSVAETLAKRLTGSNSVITVPYGSEAGRFQKVGIPTVLCGPGDIAQAHQPDEYIEVSQITACEAFVRKLGRELI